MQNLLFVVLIVFGTSAYAMQGVFWQPQLRDLHISDHAWAGLMAQVREQGFDTLVLQWTRHDDSFSEVQQWQQLLKKTIAARQAGLKIIVGLHWDSQFFTLQKQPADALAAYLRQLAARDLQQLVLWQSRLPFVPDGWYVSAEIDDKNWRSQAQRKRLLGWLSSLRRGLGEHSGEPVYISSFFAGNMSPEAYGALLTDISEAGYQVWVQDGAGVGALPDRARQLYLERAGECKHQASPARGFIYEIFKQHRQSEFVAYAHNTARLPAGPVSQSGCGHQQLYFSLRYLPAANEVMER
jgi:hypothetical protein